jgi:hypothetical protein
MNIVQVEGRLVPTNPDAVDESTRDKILDAAVNNGLGLIIKDCGLKGTLVLDSSTTAFGGRKAAFNVISALCKLNKVEGVKELGYKGSLTIVVSTKPYPTVFRVTVKEDGKVRYQEASYVWSNPASF